MLIMTQQCKNIIIYFIVFLGKGENMGIIYKEMVRHRKISLWRGLLLLVLCIMTTNLLVNSVHYSSMYAVDFELLMAAGGILALYVLRSVFHITYTHRICYMYKLIDKELIFERVMGDSRKVILSIDMKNVEMLVPAKDARDLKDISRTYKFLCSSSKCNVYCCVVKIKDQKVKVYLQPSPELVRKLKMVMGSKIDVNVAS